MIFIRALKGGFRVRLVGDAYGPPHSEPLWHEASSSAPPACLDCEGRV